MNAEQLSEMPAARKKRRWWVYVLVAVAGLLLTAIVAVVLILGYAKSLVNNYTTTTATPLVKTPFDPERMKELEARWVEFDRTLKSGQKPPPFVIAADDINLALSKNKGMRDHVHFVITNNQVLAEFSTPLDQTGRKELKGRYLNGVAKVNLAFQDGWLTVNLGGAEANGKAIPGWLLRRIQKENLLKDLDRNQDVVNLLQEMESVQVKDNHIVLTPQGSGK
jgi:hypothetical protein